MTRGFDKTGELLAQLSAIGRPRLSKMESGAWFAALEFPAPEGVTAEVKSDFKHDTPEQALQTVIDRLGGLRSMVNIRTAAIGHVDTIES